MKILSSIKFVKIGKPVLALLGLWHHYFSLWNESNT